MREVPDDGWRREPVTIFNTTTLIYPGEMLIGERIVGVPGPAAVHVGVKITLTWKVWRWQKQHSQTVTCWVVKSSATAAAA